MRITYDSEVDALYIRFIDTTVTTQHITEGIAVDYDANGKIAGIEVLDAIKRFGNKDVFKKVVELIKTNKGYKGNKEYKSQ
ncbi:MAG TPA: DUF2283 domain-containing protein [Caldisericia bacterium]|nr:DUF2283 domain-containing protein [Caldisericia bacterium]